MFFLIINVRHHHVQPSTQKASTGLRVFWVLPFELNPCGELFVFCLVVGSFSQEYLLGRFPKSLLLPESSKEIKPVNLSTAAIAPTRSITFRQYNSYCTYDFRPSRKLNNFSFTAYVCPTSMWRTTSHSLKWRWFNKDSSTSDKQ